MAQSQLEAEQKNQASASIVAAALTLPILVATASADAHDTRQRAITRTAAAAAAGTTLNMMDFSQEKYNIRSDPIYSSTNAWINYSLRKTTLSKNESVRGLVYFKRPDLTKYQDLRLISLLVRTTTSRSTIGLNFTIPTNRIPDKQHTSKT